jgi:hypothetical protein
MSSTASSGVNMTIIVTSWPSTDARGTRATEKVKARA